MKRNNQTEKLISKEEALRLFNHTGIREIYTAMELYQFYREKIGTNKEENWDVITFIYNTGVVHGIRKERKKLTEKRGLYKG